MSKKSNSSSGIGFTGLLTIVFITLKLIDKIDWSWWWVLSPIWISVSIAVIALAILGLIAFWPEKKQKEEPPKEVTRKSKFMDKLEEAMKESERKRNEKLNQN